MRVRRSKYSLLSLSLRADQRHHNRTLSLRSRATAVSARQGGPETGKPRAKRLRQYIWRVFFPLSPGTLPLRSLSLGQLPRCGRGTVVTGSLSWGGGGGGEESRRGGGVRAVRCCGTQSHKYTRGKRKTFQSFTGQPQRHSTRQKEGNKNTVS